MCRISPLPLAAAVILAAALPSAAEDDKQAPSTLAQVDSPVTSPNIQPPPPPVVPRPRVVPDPLGNRPERTTPPDEEPGAQEPGAQEPGAPGIEADVVLVSVSSGADPGLGRAVARTHGLTLVEETRLALIDRQVLRLRIPDGRPIAEVVAALGGDPRLTLAQPSFVYRLEAAGTAGVPQYTVDTLHLREAHAIARGRGVTVALIDTDIVTGHEALRGGRIRRLSVLEPDAAGSADHGTRMAGLIAASGSLVGVAPGVELVAIEAFGPDPAGGREPRSNSLAVAKALDVAAREGAQVINMSFAGHADPLVAEMLDGLAARGTVLVAAAGNRGPGAPSVHPAAHPRVIAVTATDAENGLFAGANRGGYVMLAAPGVDVIAPTAGGRYAIVSGTSVAAAHVSGIAALILERLPAITPAQLSAVLVGTAVDLGRPGRDPDYGAGLVDPAGALSHPAERLARPAE